MFRLALILILCGCSECIKILNLDLGLCFGEVSSFSNLCFEIKISIPENSSAEDSRRISDRRRQIQLRIMLICFPLTLPLVHLSSL